MLILPITRKWFDMVERREKKEEYRSNYIGVPESRKTLRGEGTNERQRRQNVCVPTLARIVTRRSRFVKLMMGAGMIGKHHKALLRNGYGKDKPTLEIEFILGFGQGREEWGAEAGKEYFILSILDAKRIV